MDHNIQLSTLPLASLDPNSPVPLYYQIEEDLRQLIKDGHLPPQATLPPEMALSDAYKVGRHTIRTALSRLVNDGLITRQAGRGTIVKPQPDRSEFYLDRSFTQQMAEMGRKAQTTVIEVTRGTITSASPEVFADNLGADCLQLNRLRFGDDEPIGMQYSTILLARCPGLEKHDFAQFGLYDILAREYNLAITQIRHTISAAVADEFEAESLQIKKGDPLLVVNTTTFLGDNSLFEYTTSYYRADLYEYSTTHKFES